MPHCVVVWQNPVAHGAAAEVVVTTAPITTSLSAILCVGVLCCAAVQQQRELMELSVDSVKVCATKKFLTGIASCALPVHKQGVTAQAEAVQDACVVMLTSPCIFLTVSASLHLQQLHEALLAHTLIPTCSKPCASMCAGSGFSAGCVPC